eukprot:TRINITY_DN35136_c0_g1_i4.p1 TRINITY_DN35136_c0_g1~~TRINITY_DN35136_c0_g1_i4.p1  ORF type:complete len:188 (-),score=11.31 TRINITY_DN35136_c0_g1_i4:184-747(-)
MLSKQQEVTDPRCYIIMGVSGCGKSTVGGKLAQRLQCKFLEGDDFHSEHNKRKMASGIQLTDDDRWPWLRSLADEINNYYIRKETLVVSCSALKPSYREVLRRGTEEQQFTNFVLLDPQFLTVQRMILGRSQQGGHFMPPSLLQSQFDTLEFEEFELFLHICEIDGQWPSLKKILEIIIKKIQTNKC